MPPSSNNRILAILILSAISCLLPITIHAQEGDPITAIIAQTEPQTLQTVRSPDGTLSAEVIVYPCTDIDGQPMSYERINLIDDDDTTMIAEQLINCGGLGSFGLWIEHWSESGAYLYYTDSRVGVPDGYVLAWIRPIWRVHLPDLEAQRLDQAIFSPDRSQLVSWEQEQITITAVDSDDQISFEQIPAELQIAHVFWLPDSGGVIYVQADVLYDLASRSTVTYIDLAANSQTLMLDTAN